MKGIVGIIVCTLMITTLLPISVMAGDETHPEISDAIGDARTIIDIKKAWFFENSTTPEYLHITIQVVKLNPNYRGTLLNGVFWTMNDVNYIAYASVGTYLGKNDFWAGLAGTNNGCEINGSLDVANGTITYKILKSIIGSLHTGNVLTRTLGATVQRTPLMEKLNWDPIFRDILFKMLGLNNLLWQDRAPDGGLGNDYTILY